MPNIITHTLFADDVQNLLDNESLKNRKKLFAAGSNGPDFLFFHNISPRDFWKPTPLRKMGSQLHSGHISEFYRDLLRLIRRQPNENLKEDMIAYGAGHLCHWALDSTAHPYIFYRTGDCKGASASRHHRFESLLDAVMLKLKRNETTETYHPAEAVCSLSPQEQKAIVNVYYPILEDLFEEDIRPVMVKEALDDWKTMQKIFHDPKGRKIRMFQKLEKPLRLDNKFSGFGVPPVPEDNHDLLNLLQKAWKNPVTGEESKATFLDLYQSALHTAVKAIELFLLAVEDPADEDAFLDFLGERNYDMGVESDEGMQYFDIEDLSL